jgi:GT2 family glycosyltransferase
MDLSIIILNYKTLGLVKNCLKAIKDLNLPYKYEVIVVDNHSNDGSVEYLEEHYFDIILLKSSKNLGFAGGNNLGLKKAVGKYILLINPDILILSPAIEIMYQLMEKNPLVGLCGPKLINPDGTLQYSCSRWPDWRLPFYRRTFLGKTNRGKKWIEHYLMQDWDHLANQKVDSLYAACYFIRRAALEEVGLFDERYFMYLEDLDLCRRFWQAGWEVWYIAEAKVIHYHQRESALGTGIMGLLKKSGRIHLQSWIKYYLKWGNKNLKTSN